MAETDLLTVPPAGRTAPQVREIAMDDLAAALREGWQDVWRAPGYSLSFGAVYAVIGFGLVWWALSRDEWLLVFPLLSDFLLIGPITAVGLYEISRRLEAGLPLSPARVYLAWRRNSAQLAFFGFLLFFIGLSWLKIAYYIYAIFFGLSLKGVSEMLPVFFTTVNGIQFLLVGNLVGGLLALFVYSVSVVGVPMVLHRDVDAVTAALTSIAAVRASPKVFLAFATLIVAVTAAGMLTLMIGLVVALPLIGHATWHLYRRAVAG